MTRQGSKLDNTPQNLPLRLYRTAQVVRVELSRRLTVAFGGEFTADYWFVLDAMHRLGPLSQADLARELNRDTASIMRTVKNMELIGLISIKRNARRHVLELTAMANDFMPKANAAVKQVLGSPAANIKPLEIVELSRILDNIFDLY